MQKLGKSGQWRFPCKPLKATWYSCLIWIGPCLSAPTAHKQDCKCWALQLFVANQGWWEAQGYCGSWLGIQCRTWDSSHTAHTANLIIYFLEGLFWGITINYLIVSDLRYSKLNLMSPWSYSVAFATENIDACTVFLKTLSAGFNKMLFLFLNKSSRCL